MQYAFRDYEEDVFSTPRGSAPPSLPLLIRWNTRSVDPAFTGCVLKAAVVFPAALALVGTYLELSLELSSTSEFE